MLHATLFRTEHRDHLWGLANRDILRVSGPFGSAEQPGALLLFRAGSRAGVLSYIDKDPFTVEGILADFTIQEWEPVVGSLARSF